MNPFRRALATQLSGGGGGGASAEYVAYAISGDQFNSNPDYTEITIPEAVEAGMMAVVVVGYDTTTASSPPRTVQRSGGGGDFAELDYQAGGAQTSGAMFWKVLDASDISDGTLRAIGDDFAGPGALALFFSGATTATNIGLVSLSGTSAIDTSAAQGVLIHYATNFATSTSPLVDTNLTRLAPDRTPSSINRPRMAIAYGPPQASVTGGPNGAAWGVHGACYIT